VVKRKIQRGKGIYLHKKIMKKNRYYPIMWCTQEDLAVGVSWTPMKFKADGFGNISAKYKVVTKHWKPGRCQFRSEKYIIDLRTYKVDDVVKCSKCGGRIDFRLFPSGTVPKLVEVNDDNKDNSQESSDS